MTAERTYVPNMPPAALVTADDLLHMHIADKRVELVCGVLVVSEPPGYLHGEVTARLARILGNYAEAQTLGTVLAGDAGFKLAASPDTVRGPDVAFVRRERLPQPSPAGFAALAPDLVVEILSPGDRAGGRQGVLTVGEGISWMFFLGDSEPRLFQISFKIVDSLLAARK